MHQFALSTQRCFTKRPFSKCEITRDKRVYTNHLFFPCADCHVTFANKHSTLGESAAFPQRLGKQWKMCYSLKKRPLRQRGYFRTPIVFACVNFSFWHLEIVYNWTRFGFSTFSFFFGAKGGNIAPLGCLVKNGKGAWVIWKVVYVWISLVSPLNWMYSKNVIVASMV